MDYWIETLSRLAFAFAAAILTVLAILMMFAGLWLVIQGALGETEFGFAALTAVGYMVISIAVFEVAKYLVEEEVMRGREMRAVSEARRSLTKFIATIAIAVFLEGLATVFQVGHKGNISDLIYPIFLLLTAMALVIGLGVFQRLTAEVESKVGRNDRAEMAAEDTGKSRTRT